MDDVVALCPRVIVIDKGRIIYDGDLRALVKQMHPDKLVSFSLTGPVAQDQLTRLGRVVEHEAGRVVLCVPHDDLHSVVAHALSELRASDLTIEDPPLEDIMRQLFRGGMNDNGDGDGDGEGEGEGDGEGHTAGTDASSDTKGTATDTGNDERSRRPG